MNLLSILKNLTFSLSLLFSLASQARSLTENLVLNAGRGKLEKVVFYLSRGADVNGQDEHHATALMMAAKYGRTKVVRELVNHPDIEINKVAWEGGWTALMFAAAYGHDGAVYELLKHKDIDVHVVDKDGFRALDLERGFPNDRVYTLLINAGA